MGIPGFINNMKPGMFVFYQIRFFLRICLVVTNKLIKFAARTMT